MQDQIKKVYFFLIGAVLCTAPFFFLLNSWSIILLVGIWLFANRPNEKWELLSKNYLFILPFFGYYLAQIYGLVISDNTAIAAFNLEKKIAVLLLPLVLSTGPQLSQTVVYKLFSWFSYLLFGASIVMLFFAGSQFINTGNHSVFYYHELANSLDQYIHAVYLSLSLATALCFFIYKHRKLNLNKVFLVDGFISITLLLVIVLLSSKTILVGLFIFFIALGFQVIRSRNHLKSLIAICAFIGIGLAVLLNTKAFERFFEIYDSNWKVISSQEQYKYDSEFNGFTLRLVLWQQTWRTLNEENVFISGVGSGDLQHELFLRYKERNLYMDLDNPNPVGYQNYNPHNQYLQEWLSTGLLGLVALISMVTVCIWKSRNLSLHILVFFSLFALFLLTESALERQHGLVQFAVIASIALFCKRED